MAPNNPHIWLLRSVWVLSHCIRKPAKETRRIWQKQWHVMSQITLWKIAPSWSLSLCPLLWGNPCHEPSYEKVPGKEVKPPLRSHAHKLGEGAPAALTASETSPQTAWPWPQEPSDSSTLSPQPQRHWTCLPLLSRWEDNFLCNNRWSMWTITHSSA